jgi:hypothetical protein
MGFPRFLGLLGFFPLAKGIVGDKRNTIHELSFAAGHTAGKER